MADVARNALAGASDVGNLKKAKQSHSMSTKTLDQELAGTDPASQEGAESMKYYKIIFSDYSETIGKQENASRMMADARRYCRMWNLEETAKEVIEITREEYERSLDR